MEVAEKVEAFFNELAASMKEGDAELNKVSLASCFMALACKKMEEFGVSAADALEMLRHAISMGPPTPGPGRRDN